MLVSLNYVLDFRFDDNYQLFVPLEEVSNRSNDENKQSERNILLYRLKAILG